VGRRASQKPRGRKAGSLRDAGDHGLDISPPLGIDGFKEGIAQQEVVALLAG